MSSDSSIIALALTLLGTLVVSTWRFATTLTKLQSVVDHLKSKERDQERRSRKLDRHELRITRLEDRAGILPSPSHPELEEYKDEDEPNE